MIPGLGGMGNMMMNQGMGLNNRRSNFNSTKNATITTQIFEHIGYTLFGNSFLMGGLSFFIITYILNMFKLYFFQLLTYIKEKFLYIVTISSEDEAYQWIIEWVHEQKWAQNARKLTLHTRYGDITKSRRDVYQDYRQKNEQKRPNLLYVPGVGIHFFFYKGNLIWFNRDSPIAKTENSSGISMFPFNMNQNFNRFGSGANQKPQTESITITTIGFSRKVIHSLIKESMEVAYKKSENKTFVFTSTNYRNNWTKICSRENRKYESVILPKKNKNLILNDINNFIDSERWYKKCGVPYRRGYLLWGPPGTGKTSYISAIAGHLKMSIAILNLSQVGLTDDRLTDLMNYCPDNCIIVLEDVDCVFRERDPTENVRFNNISFSGLLNAIDGVGSKEGRILFMTTNHIDKINPGLMRPGRCDLKVEFGLSTSEQIEGMFLKFFPDNKKVLKEVLKIVPENLVTCAQLQGWFLLNKKNPENCLVNYKQFLDESKEDLKKMIENSAKEEKLKKKKKKRMEKMKELRACGISLMEARRIIKEEEEEEKTPISKNLKGDQLFEKSKNDLNNKKVEKMKNNKKKNVVKEIKENEKEKDDF